MNYNQSYHIFLLPFYFHFLLQQFFYIYIDRYFSIWNLLDTSSQLSEFNSHFIPQQRSINHSFIWKYILYLYFYYFGYNLPKMLFFVKLYNIFSYKMSEKDKSKMKIGHDLDDLEQNMILTLKDQRLIRKGNDHNLQLNQEDDILENITKRQNQQAKHNAELKKKLQRLSNAATSHLEGDSKNSLLPHYDDYHYKAAQTQLQDGGQIKPKKSTDHNQLFNKRKFKNATVSEDYADQPTTNKLNSQYLASKGRKKKQNSKQLLDYLNQTAHQNIINDNDHKRPLQIDNIIDDSLDKLKKKIKLQQSLKADISSSNSFQNDQQFMLLKSIQKSRKQRQEQRKNQMQQLLSIIKEEDQISQDKEPEKVVQIQLNPIAFKPSDLKVKREDIPISQTIRGTGTSSIMFTRLPSQYSQKLKIQQNQLPQNFNQITPEELQKMKEQLQFMEDKSVGMGLSGALQYLRENSYLSKQEYVGRAADKNPQIKPQDGEIKLQYRNASGKLMKPKQAFRYLCASFHGEGPGKNKIQKRKKREFLEQRIKQQANTQGTLMKLLSQHQSKSNSAYMTLQFGSKKK